MKNGTDMLDWDLIRYFLAVARTGSTLAAARELKQSQPTVARRIAALEQALGQRLFERHQGGYRVTADGCALVREAEAVEAAARHFWEQSRSQHRRVAGTVRFTCFDMFANLALGPALQEFARLYPEVKVDVVVTERQLDLVAGEADIALRAGSRPASGPLVCRKVGEDSWALHCSRSYAAAHGVPRSLAELEQHQLIGGDGLLAEAPPFRWLAEHAPDAPIRYRCNTVQNLITSVAAGLGVTMLPCAFVDPKLKLIRCMAPPPDLSTEGWLITHERLKDEPRIRAMMDFLAAYATQRWYAATARGEPFDADDEPTSLISAAPIADS